MWMPWRWSGCRNQLLTFKKMWSIWFLKGHCGGLDLAWTPGTHKTALSLLFSWMGEEKWNERLMDQDKDRDNSLTNYYHRKNRLKEINLIYCKSNQSKVIRNKKNHKKLPPHSSLFSGIHFMLSFLYLLPHSGAWEQEMWVVVTFCSCCSNLLRRQTPHTLSLFRCGVRPIKESSPWISPVWILHVCCSSSQSADVQHFSNRLLQCGANLF